MGKLLKAEQRDIESGLGGFVGGQVEARAGQLLELADEDAAPRQVVVQRRAAWIDQALEQHAAAHRRSAVAAWQLLQALAGNRQVLALLALLLAVAQGALSHMTHRTINHPWIELLSQHLQQRSFTKDEVKLRTGRTEELAERVQHN